MNPTQAPVIITKMTRIKTNLFNPIRSFIIWLITDIFLFNESMTGLMKRLNAIDDSKSVVEITFEDYKEIRSIMDDLRDKKNSNGRKMIYGSKVVGEDCLKLNFETYAQINKSWKLKE